MESKVIFISDRISKNGWDSVNVELENESGNYLIGKTEDNKSIPFKEGDTITYTTEESQWGKKIKYQKPQQNGFTGGKGGYKSEPFEHKAAGFSLGYAKDILVAAWSNEDAPPMKSDDMFLLADKMYNWLVSKKQA